MLDSELKNTCICDLIIVAYAGVLCFIPEIWMFYIREQLLPGKKREERFR